MHCAGQELIDNHWNGNIILPSVLEAFQHHYPKMADDLLQIYKSKGSSDKIGYNSDNVKSLVTMGGSIDVIQSEACLTHMDFTDPLSLIEENGSANLSHTGKTKTTDLQYLQKMGFTLTSVLWQAYSRQFWAKISQDSMQLWQDTSGLSRRCSFRQYKCFQELEELYKEEVESFTEFWKKLLKPGGYAGTLADFFMIDEWILAFSMSGFIVMPLSLCVLL